MKKPWARTANLNGPVRRDRILLVSRLKGDSGRESCEFVPVERGSWFWGLAAAGSSITELFHFYTQHR